MEENKNNAVEKVENVVREKNYTGEYSNSLKNGEYLPVSPVAEPKSEDEKGEVLDKKLEYIKIREQKRNEREKIRMARQREKAKLEEQRLIEEGRENERRHQLKQKRMQLKQEERNRRAKEKREERRKNPAKSGWLAAVISLGIATLVLSSVLTFTFLMPTESDNRLEDGYHKSFFDTVEQVKNMDVNLSKSIASKDKGAMQGYLLDLAINSELAESNIQQLPLQDENKFYTGRLINQIGDFAKYLTKKIANGNEITDSDKQSLKRLYSLNLTLKDTLLRAMGNMGEDFSFASLNEQKSNEFLQNFTDLENLSVEYPELIYDGPFSDGINDREIKGLPLNKITQAEAKDEFIKIFAKLGVDGVVEEGKTNGVLECFNFSASVKGENLYAQITERGGKLVMFDYAGSCKEVNYQEETALKTAEEFLSQLNILSMKAVWSNLSDNVYTFNFAYYKDQVVVYPDMIKVRVCAETNMVIGLEASGYYTNHVERDIQKPVLSESKAKTFCNDEIEIENTRLVIIPVGNKSEKLCYEFNGVLDDSVYYVYIDAITGKQVEMFRVIESTEGKLLI